jgi:hypothetical protein
MAGLSASATFQPRRAKLRVNLGHLYYPSESSHVFEKYWDYLSCLDQHPDFPNESPYCQRHMLLFSQAISAMPKSATFVPRPAAEAKQSDLETAEDAALSRLRPIKDGPDQWQEHSSAATGPGGPAPG